MLILFALGTCLAVLGARVVARRSRRRFQEYGDAFRCRLRVQDFRSAIWPALGRRWCRPMWALWDDDVLVVRRGPVLARPILLRTQPYVDGVHSLLGEAPRRCGPGPIGVVLKIWDGSRIEIAASDLNRMLMVGPYLTAAINDLPPAPAPRRRI